MANAREGLTQDDNRAKVLWIMSVVMCKHNAGYCIFERVRDLNIVTLPFKEII